MSLTARTSQLICLAYIVTVVWFVSQNVRPESFFSPTVLREPRTQSEIAIFEQRAYAGRAEPLPWAERFARRSPLQAADVALEQQFAAGAPVVVAPAIVAAGTPAWDRPLPPLAGRAPADAAALVRRTYRVRPGDTLRGICRASYGVADDACLTAVLAANPTLRGNPNLLQVDQELVLPPLEAVDAGPTDGARLAAVIG